MSERTSKPPFRRGGKPFGKGRPGGQRPAWRDREAASDGPVILYGWHTVTMALQNRQRRIRKLLRHRECRAAARGGEHRDARDAGDGAPRADRRAARARCRASGPARGGRSPALARHRDARARRHGAGARPDHRSAQCRRDPALGGGVCGEGDRHHRAALAGGDRRAGEIRLRRARAGAAGDGAKSGARADAAQRARLHDGRARQRGQREPRRRSSCASRWRWCSAPKARDCGN